MAESLVLFESVINSRWFLRTSIVLFLNKTDVFKAKLSKVPLERYFPEYTGAFFFFLSSFVSPCRRTYGICADRWTRH